MRAPTPGTSHKAVGKTKHGHGLTGSPTTSAVAVVAVVSVFTHTSPASFCSKFIKYSATLATTKHCVGKHHHCQGVRVRAKCFHPLPSVLSSTETNAREWLPSNF